MHILLARSDVFQSDQRIKNKLNLNSDWMSHIQRALKADLLRDRESTSKNVFAQLIACYLKYIKRHYSLNSYEMQLDLSAFLTHLSRT